MLLYLANLTNFRKASVGIYFSSLLYISFLIVYQDLERIVSDNGGVWEKEPFYLSDVYEEEVNILNIKLDVFLCNKMPRAVA